MSQQFVKNNDKPTSDSVLWEFADDWKISGSSGVPYASLPGVERINSELYDTLRNIVTSKNLDVVEYQSYFFALTFFDNKDNKDGKYKPKNPNVASNWHVFSFENEADALKKNEYQKKFMKWDVPTTTTANTVPKPAGQQTLRTQPVSTKLSGIPEQLPPNPNIISMNSIFSYTDPQWVTTDIAKQLETQGYSYLPSSLCQPNTRVEDVHDVDAESGNDIVVGEQHLFLMGRIINVKIADK